MCSSDLSGLVSEHVMGIMVQEGIELGTFNANAGSGSWGGIPETKYYDSYEYDTDFLNHGRGHLGDATREVIRKINVLNGGWYGDYSVFPYSTTIWFYRGGSTNARYSGVFMFNYTGGGGGNRDRGFRVVLALE